MRPRKRIPHMSPKRTQEAREYAKRKRLFLKEHTICFRCHYYTSPQRRSVHHFYGRVGSLLSWVPGFRLVCNDCHSWIESHRKESIGLGFRSSEDVWNRPSLVIPELWRCPSCHKPAGECTNEAQRSA